MTIKSQIETSGKIIGNKARLGAVIYEQRTNGEWRRVKNQGVASRAFARSERVAERDAKIVAQFEASVRVQPTPMTKERQAPTLKVTGSKAKVADFVAWAARMRVKNAS